ncbi:uncharacterized protein BCR38DRAFT_354931 [Pseudomassariella vexata]|uniref:Uncharacterized protein n=1 Tax=Pseudomassariella vexata TaxID=1141098 RepID=A0A1Y2DEY1_9PEZI|nr:uncharacterized protein BCR38DRAFT_354931 [Pseudomassariella vexata]ORY57225.1 hypothetical protein BCR38DRAFT_354931 [Pseudomassariella vexata]
MAAHTNKTSGYIGGEAFYSLYEAHSDYEYTLLVRNEERGKPVAEKYPKVRLVYGTLDSADVIEKEAAAADIVVHTANSADNIPSARAIAKGISAGHTDEKPGYWIHVCGTGILQWYDQEFNRTGQPPLPEQKYHDIDDIDRVLTLPHQAEHRDVDEVVLQANQTGGVRTLIVGPPTIYGRGRGPVNQRSMQVYNLAKQTLEGGFAPIVEPGKTEWDNVHIHDLGAFFVLAVDAALNPEKSKNPEIFGPRAYYFLEHGTHLWADVAKWIADEAAKQGLIEKAETKTVPHSQAACKTWGWNSKGVAARAKKYLDWEPKGKSLKDEIPEVVKSEAARLKTK